MEENNLRKINSNHFHCKVTTAKQLFWLCYWCGCYCIIIRVLQCNALKKTFLEISKKILIPRMNCSDKYLRLVLSKSRMCCNVCALWLSEKHKSNALLEFHLHFSMMMVMMTNANDDSMVLLLE